MLNKLFVCGSLGSDVTARETKTGQPYYVFSLVVKETYEAKNGGKFDNTYWLEMTAFGQTGAIVSGLKVGDTILVEGKLTSNLGESKNGQPARHFMNITALNITKMAVTGQVAPAPAVRQQQQQQQDPYAYPFGNQLAQAGRAPLPDDIPF